MICAIVAAVVTARTSVTIERPADEVFAVVADVENNPRWQRGMRSCRWTSGGPLRVGSTYEQTARFLWRDLVNAFEITAVEPGRRLSFRSTAGTFPIEVTRTVEPLGQTRSRFTEAVAGDAKGVYRVAAPVLQLLVRASIRRDLPRLRALVEQR